MTTKTLLFQLPTLKFMDMTTANAWQCHSHSNNFDVQLSEKCYSPIFPRQCHFTGLKAHLSNSIMQQKNFTLRSAINKIKYELNVPNIFESITVSDIHISWAYTNECFKWKSSIIFGRNSNSQESWFTIILFELAHLRF